MPQTIQQLHPTLWVSQSDFFSTNSGIFFNHQHACLIDPALVPEEIRAMKALLSDQKLKPENLVLTHMHWDHLFGPENFQDVRLIAQHASQTTLSGEEADLTIEKVKRFESENKVRRSRAFRLPCPDLTFENIMSIQMGDCELQLLHAPGHAADQCVIYQPNDGILWAADMLSDLEIPFVFDNLTAYQATLEKLSRLDVSILIPGHGSITQDPFAIRKRFEEDIAYLEELRQHVEDAVSAGHSLKEAQVACTKMRFKYSDDNAQPHYRNVETAYLEFS